MDAPEEIHVLLIFACDTGVVEQLVLAAAVGAMQMRAGIRLRRMADVGDSHDANSERMDQDYVAPRVADIAWADGLVLAVPEHLIPLIRSLGPLTEKPAVSLLTDAPPHTVNSGLGELHFLSDGKNGPVDRERARMLGRAVVETIRARR